MKNDGRLKFLQEGDDQVYVAVLRIFILRVRQTMSGQWSAEVSALKGRQGIVDRTAAGSASSREMAENLAITKAWELAEQALRQLAGQEKTAGKPKRGTR